MDDRLYPNDIRNW